MSSADLSLEGTEFTTREKRTQHLAIKPSDILLKLKTYFGELPSKAVLKPLVDLSLAIQSAKGFALKETGLITCQFIDCCIREILQLRETNPGRIDQRIAEMTLGYALLVSLPANLINLDDKSQRTPFKGRFVTINTSAEKVPQLSTETSKKFGDFQGRILAETWDIWQEILGKVTTFALLDSAGFKPKLSSTRRNFCTIETESPKKIIPIQVKTDLYSPLVWFSLEENQDTLQSLSFLLTINVERLRNSRETFEQLLSKNPQSVAGLIVNDLRENVIILLKEK